MFYFSQGLFILNCLTVFFETIEFQIAGNPDSEKKILSAYVL